MERVMYPPLGRVQSPEGHSISGWLAARLRAGLRRLLRTQTAGDTPLCLEARVSLGPKKSLVLVNCCGKRVLLAVSGDTIVPVAELPNRRRSKTVLNQEAAQ